MAHARCVTIKRRAPPGVPTWRPTVEAGSARSLEAVASIHAVAAFSHAVAKLPPRLKVSVLCFRRAAVDEVLLVPREVKRSRQWGLPSVEAEAGEAPRDAALRVAAQLLRDEPLATLDLGVEATYRVSAGPRAGEWTERFVGVEVAASARSRDGEWMPHYEAKALAGADAARVREAFSLLRELAPLKP